MKFLPLEQNSDEWMEFRKGKISGTRLGDIYAKRGGRKIGFYETIAERLSTERDDEDRMARGLRLEDDAIAKFEQVTGKKVNKGGVCVSDVDSRIINSPDGLITNDGKTTEAVEIKCLSPARHWQAVIENKVPSEFESQAIQYFVVNTDLQTLYFVFYDDTNNYVPFHTIELTRDALGDAPQQMLDFQIAQLKEIDEIVERYSF